LMLGGTWAAHALDYRLVVPDANARATLLAATGHGYEEWLPLTVALGAALALVALVRGASDLRNRSSRPSAWPVVLAPSLSSALQEHLERLFAGADWWHAAFDPTFMPGLMLQVPFGLLVFMAARLVLGVARRVVLALAPPRRRPSAPPRTSLPAHA